MQLMTLMNSPPHEVYLKKEAKKEAVLEILFFFF